MNEGQNIQGHRGGASNNSNEQQPIYTSLGAIHLGPFKDGDECRLQKIDVPRVSQLC